MSISTDWLVAPEADAKSVASIVTTEERSFDDWPSISLKGIGDLELQHLAACLRGDDRAADSVLGELLYEESEDGPFVAAVDSRFIKALAAIDEPSISTVSEMWRQSEHLRDWQLSDVAETLSQMVAFARRSQDSGTPVLQLMTL